MGNVPIEKAPEGNRKAGIDALVALQDRLYAAVYVLTGGSEETLDVLQNANAAIMAHIGEFDPSRPAWPWFKAFAVNQVLLWRTEAKRSRVSFNSETIEQLAETLTDESFPEKKTDVDYLQLLRACMQKLAPKDRDLLEERYYRMTSVEKMAEKLHVTYTSLRKLMQRLRESLRRCMDRKISASEEGLSGEAEETGDDAFFSSMERIFDGQAGVDDREAFIQDVEASPENRRNFTRQAMVHALLECRRKAVFAQGLPQNGTKPVFRVSARFAKIAAALALLAGGIAVWHGLTTQRRGIAENGTVRTEKRLSAASVPNSQGVDEAVEPVEDRFHSTVPEPLAESREHFAAQPSLQMNRSTNGRLCRRRKRRGK